MMKTCGEKKVSTEHYCISHVFIFFAHKSQSTQPPRNII
jgi:hypothetical protein